MSGAVFSGVMKLTGAVKPYSSLSYVPLIAPSTSLARVKFLASIADSFIYIVSKARIHSSIQRFVAAC